MFLRRVEFFALVLKGASNPIVLVACRLSPMPFPFPPLSPSLSGCKIRSKVTTYTRELGAAVTALGNSSALLDVQNSDVTTGSLDDSGPVGAGVVAAKISTVSYFVRQDSALAIFRGVFRK